MNIYVGNGIYDMIGCAILVIMIYASAKNFYLTIFIRFVIGLTIGNSRSTQNASNGEFGRRNGAFKEKRKKKINRKPRWRVEADLYFAGVDAFKSP